MLCLGLETATLRPGVGLAEDGQVLWELAEPDPATKAQAIFVYLDQALREGRLNLARLDLVAVTAGPGSFTGLRVGLSAAKGLAFALDKPTVGVSTLAVLARGAGAEPGRLVAPLLDARRGMVYAALFQAEAGDNLARLLPDAALTPQAWAEELAGLGAAEPIILTGPGLATYAGLFQEALGERVSFASPERWPVRPGLVARLGLAAAGRGEAVPAERLEAAYLRPVDAVKPKRELVSL